MSKWAFALAAAVIVAVGCSGGGGSSSSGGGGGNPGESTAFVTLANVPGQFHSVYLTGQGRAQGDLIAIMRRVSIDDGNGFPISTIINPFLRLQLNGYSHQHINLNVPTTISRVFDHYNLEVQELDVDNGDGTFTSFTGQNQPLVQQTFPAYFRVFPARETSITVRLDDSMFVQSGGTYVFDSNQFELANFSQEGTDPLEMNGFISDYIMFDLSNLSGGVAAQPPFPDGSGNATAFFINGDNFAIGQLPPGPPDQAPPDPVPFFALTPIGYVPGLHIGPRTATDPNTGLSVAIPGTYVLNQPDPRNLAFNITAFEGTYKNYTKTINSVGNDANHFEIIAFPSRKDDGIDDCVMFNVINGQITNLYFGQMNLTGGSLARKHGRGVGGSSISAFPVVQVTNPENTANEITGTVIDADSSDPTRIHSGHYTLNAPNLPTGFSTSGRFIVYRR